MNASQVSRRRAILGWEPVALMVLVLLLWTQFRASAQGPLLWSAGPTLPSPRAQAVAALAPGDAVLLLGGLSPGGATVVPKLAEGAAAWTTSFPIDKSRAGLGAVRFSGTGILVFGGRIGNEATNEALLYDYYLGDSQDAAQLGTPREQFAFAADDLYRCYAIGGRNNSSQALASAERYDSTADAWSPIAPLPAARYGATAVSVDGRHIYVFGGATASAVQSTVYRYVIASNLWESLTPMPVGVRHAVAVLAEGRIYVTGGISASGPVATVQVLDLASGQWTTNTPMPSPRYSHGAAYTGDGRLLIAGGYDATGVASASVFQSQQLNIPETLPVFNTTPVTLGSLDRAYGYDVGATGNPEPTYSLVTAPAGMTIDPASGSIGWQPIAGQIGIHPVTVRATNRVGSANQSFNITVVSDTFAPTAPTDVQLVDVTANSVTLSWSGATDATGIHHYAVYRQYRCGFHGIQRCYALVQGNITSDSVTISGLSPLTSYTYAVRSFDAAGLQSPNSRLISFKTLSPPTSFRYTGATTLPANFPLQLQFFANANPAAAFSIVSGPAGLTLDPETGVASWTPTPDDVGAHTLVVRATNSGGTADLSVDLTVRPDVPVLSVNLVPGPDGLGDAIAGTPWTAQVLDASHTTSTYEIVSAPAGMTINSVTGQLNWLPTTDDSGANTVKIRGTNAANSTELSFEFYCYFTNAPTNIQVTGLTELHPTATWSAPTGLGAELTAGYTVTATSRYRSGRAWRTQRLTWQTEGAAPSVVLTGLVSGRTYTLSVNALNEFEDRGLANSPGLVFVPRPALPSVTWTISGANGGAAVVAGQDAVVHFTELNPAYGPASYVVVDAPPGFVLDPVTGEGHWTPSADNVGVVPVTVRITNQIGSRDATLNFVVNFSGAVVNAVATRSGDSAFVSWQPPAWSAVPVAGYRVTMHWQVGSRSYSSTRTTTSPSLAFGLVPTGAVWHKGVTITPIDAAGRLGAASALILYNNTLPVGMPPPAPPWIEQVAVGPDGVPSIQVRGSVGATAALEVSSNLLDWDPLETCIIGAEGFVICPDAASQNGTIGFYRLVSP